MLLLSNRKILTIAVETDTNNAASMTSISEAAHASYVSSTQFGAVLFHEEQFVFGITDKIQNYQLTATGTFVTSLNKFRKRTYYSPTAFAADTSITANTFT